MNRYQRNKLQYSKWCERYNGLQVPVVVRDYLYDHLKLTQAQARVFYHCAWLCGDQDTEFTAPKFRGIAGIGMREKIPEFLEALKEHLLQLNAIIPHRQSMEDRKHFRPRYRKFYYDLELKKPHYYAFLADIGNTVLMDLDIATECEDVETVPLSLEPARLPGTRGRNSKAIQKKARSRSANEPELEQSRHMQDLIDYLHGKRVCYNFNLLAKNNHFDLRGEKRIIYKPKLRTDRFFSDGKILYSYWDRQQLYNGCYLVDISHAQLSIVAKLWNLPKLTEFFRSNGKIWDSLIEYGGTSKRDAKEFIYAAVYGMNADALSWRSSKLCSHDLVRELISARDVEIQQIIDGKTLITAFGDELCASNLEQARSILSTYVQSYEQYLVLHAFRECIRDSKDVVMVGYLFDGFYLRFTHNPKYPERIINKIMESMAAKGRELGMDIDCSYELILD